MVRVAAAGPVAKRHGRRHAALAGVDLPIEVGGELAQVQQVGGETSGRLKQRSFDTKEGEKRTVIELEVDEIGPSLRYATAKVTRASRGEGGGGFGGGGGGFSGGGGGGGGASDPWSTPAGPSDEPPF